jgi:hypothetical protein
MYNLFLKEETMSEKEIDIGFGPGNFTPSDGTGSDPWNPLADLWKPKYDYSLLQYPADLQSVGKGHSIEFYMSTTTSIVEDVTKFGSEISSGAKEGVEIGVSGAAEAGTTIVQQVKEGNYSGAASTASNLISKAVQPIVSTNFQRAKTDLSATVSLYMPETLNFQYAADYSDMTLAAAAESAPLVGSAARAITGVLGSDFAKLALNKAGYAFNPQAQLLFNGINFRTYSFSYTFTPRSSQEAEKVQEIIRTFRRFAAPKIVTEAAGFFYRPPGTFKLKFMFNGQENLNVNRIAESVLEAVEVNYAPNGWSAHNDGKPTQIQMTLSFKEIELIDRAKIDNYY